MKNKLSAIDLYLNKVFKIVMVLIPLTAMAAGVTLTFIKLLGYYPELSWILLSIFDMTCIFYVAAGVLIIHHCEDEAGKIKPHVFHYAIAYLLAVAFVQWNFLSYMIPSRDLWAFALFFVALSALFLNSRIVVMCSLVVLPSMFLSWILRGDVLLPARDANFFPELSLRVVCLMLGCFALWILTHFIEQYLVSELEKLAEYDTLTQLHTRRKLEDVAEKMIGQSIRSGKSFTLLMCDLDDFKKVNDTYGHKCGDRVLQYVAEAVLKNLGDADTAFRYGGEEFLILIDADAKTALSRAEQIRHAVESDAVSHEGQPVPVTITIGACNYAGDDTLDSMIKTADERMYCGKRNGKNQVVSRGVV